MEKFYGAEYKNLQEISQIVRNEISQHGGIEHLRSRIKTPASVLGKLEKRNLQGCVETAFANLFDLIGIRVIVRFIDDVYSICEHVKESFETIEVKDYIKNPKENGYRSLHMIIKVTNQSTTLPVEIQIRTISQDSWASLEHKMKYKKEITHAKLISSELKRCADEMASIDISMQTINDMIRDGINN